MRNQQLKKVNRIFFSGQDEEKRKWIEQMAVEGWQLISVNSVVYSFQRVESALIDYQTSYKSILGKDFQRSMPLYQDSSQDWGAMLPDQKTDQNKSIPSSKPLLTAGKLDSNTNKHRIMAAVTAITLLLIALSTKVTLISTGDFLSLFKLHFVTSIMFIGLCLAFAGTILIKRLLKFFSAECKSKK